MNTIILSVELNRFLVIENDCWIWQGHIDEDGYGKVKYKGKTEQAHRIIYEISNNIDLPSTTHVHHDKCRTKACVNPTHMQTVDIQKHNYYKQKITLDSDIGKKIIKLYVYDGISANKIGIRFGISCTTITLFLNQTGARNRNSYKVKQELEKIK